MIKSSVKKQRSIDMSNYCSTVVSIEPLQIGQWTLTATSVSTHCLQNVACRHGTKAMFSRAATRQQGRMKM